MKTLVLLFAISALAFAADISGKWSFEVVLDAGGGSPNFEFTQTGETLTGMYHGQFGDLKLTGTVKGSGTLDGASKMKGTVDYGEVGKGTFTATKK
jgi:hypothetical protein